MTVLGLPNIITPLSKNQQSTHRQRSVNGFIVALNKIKVIAKQSTVKRNMPTETGRRNVV